MIRKGNVTKRAWEDALNSQSEIDKNEGFITRDDLPPLSRMILDDDLRIGDHYEYEDQVAGSPAGR